MPYLIRTAWSGTSGGPGVTTMAVNVPDSTFLSPASAQVCVDAVRAFWNSQASYLPDNISLQVSPQLDDYTLTTAELIGTVSAATPPTAVNGTATGGFSMASGYKINLVTSSIAFGRRIRGRIFVVPSDADVFTTNGIVGSTVQTNVASAGNTLIAAMEAEDVTLGVWSRPNISAPGGPRDGAFYPVTTMSVGAKGAVLRGRRDG